MSPVATLVNVPFGIVKSALANAVTASEKTIVKVAVSPDLSAVSFIDIELTVGAVASAVKLDDVT